MTYIELLDQEDKLHNEAKKILNESGLLKLISKYGNVDIGGSYKTRLMVWRDIDIGVDNLPSEDVLWKIAREIYSLDYINSITIVNNLRKKNTNYPKGWYFGIKYGEKGIVWKIDLWFAEAKADLEFENWLIKNLNNENKKIILKIKNEVWENPLYKKQFFSTDIYEAVINDGVSSLKEFENYLAKTKRKLL